MIKLDLGYVCYIFDIDKILYIKGFLNDSDNYTILISFSNEKYITIDDLTYLNYIKILDILKKED